MQECQAQLRITLQRIADVESINVDLEARLEAQAKEYIELESDAAESYSANVSTSAFQQFLLVGSWQREHCSTFLFRTSFRNSGIESVRHLVFLSFPA